MTMASPSFDHVYVRESGLRISGLNVSLLDANLRLSDQSEGVLDGLFDSKAAVVDFLHELENLEKSISSMSLDSRFVDSKGSTVADFLFKCKGLEDSVSSMSLDSRFEPLPLRDGRERRGERRRRFRIDPVDFDPPAQRQPNRRASPRDDVSVPSTQSMAAPLPFRDERLMERQASDPEIRFEKLAESMQRSEVTRRQVMMQRQMLSPEQQWALQEAKERLIKEAQHQPRHVHLMQLSPEQQRALQEAKEAISQEAQHRPRQVRPTQLSTEQQWVLHEAKEKLVQVAQHHPRHVRPTQLSSEQQWALHEAKETLDKKTQHQPKQVCPMELSSEQQWLLQEAKEKFGQEAQHRPRQVRHMQQRQDKQLHRQHEQLRQQNQHLSSRMASFIAMAA